MIFSWLLLAASIPAVCQAVVQGNLPTEAIGQGPVPAVSPETAPAPVPAAAAVVPAGALLTFKDSDVKFSVAQLMEILQDKRHEGWVLAAYPDPKTKRPLIGAGFSLDLPAREHPQRDPLNPNPFYEPASADLWQAAGLDSGLLAKILDDFQQKSMYWTNRQFRRNIRYLPAQITEEDANKLVRIAIVQAALNARAYCRNFDALTASQQMAITQLVYQMGVNLEQFTQFRALINHDVLPDGSQQDFEQMAALHRTPAMNAAYWDTVQRSLMQSQWARLYRARAIAVIAMLDPNYASSPTAAERRISAILRPARRSRVRANASEELVSEQKKSSRSAHAKTAKRKKT
jgi:hypothetical protein